MIELMLLLRGRCWWTGWVEQSILLPCGVSTLSSWSAETCCCVPVSHPLTPLCDCVPVLDSNVIRTVIREYLWEGHSGTGNYHDIIIGIRNVRLNWYDAVHFLVVIVCNITKKVDLKVITKTKKHIVWFIDERAKWQRNTTTLRLGLK